MAGLDHTTGGICSHCLVYRYISKIGPATHLTALILGFCCDKYLLCMNFLKANLTRPQIMSTLDLYDLDEP